MTVFDSAGALGRMTTLLPDDSPGATLPLGVFADGRLLLGWYQQAAAPGLKRDSIALRTAHPDGTIIATIGRFPDSDQLIEPADRGYSMRPVAFSRRSYWLARGSTVIVATNEDFGFRSYGAGGRLLRSVRRAHDQVPVTADAIAAWADDFLSNFPAGMDALKAQRRAALIAPPHPTWQPPHDRVLVSETGEVWIQEYPAPGSHRDESTWSIFDAEGRWIAQLSIPSSITPQIIGRDDMFAIRRDVNDVPHLQQFRVPKR